MPYSYPNTSMGFTARGQLTEGEVDKLIRGSHLEAEFLALETALNGTLQTPGSLDNITYGMKNNVWVELIDATGAVSVALVDLSDVDVTGLTSGMVLQWDGATWNAVTLSTANTNDPSGGTGVSDLSDVDMTGIDIGYTLVWDGTQWIVQPGGGGGDCVLAPTTSAATTYNLGLLDEARMLRFTDGTGVTLNLSLVDATAMTTGATTQWRQMGAGAVTLVPEGGITVNTKTGLVSNGANSQVMLFKVSDTEFDLTGDVIA